MAYNNAIPQATDRITDSQAPLLANFVAIKTVIDINHVTFDDPSGNQGKHKFATFPEQAAAPATVADEVNLFSQESSYTVGKTVLAYQNEVGTVYDIGDGTGGNPGWSILPSGILMKWGFLNWQIADGQATSKVITFASSPKFHTLNSIIFQPVLGGGYLDATVIFTNIAGTFVANQDIEIYVTKYTGNVIPTSNFNFYYYAIGTPQ